MTENRTQEKLKALASFLDCDVKELEQSGYDDNSFEYEFNNEEYLVLTDNEATDQFVESIENYVDDCILSDLPDNLRNYFDTDRFINDVLIGDGRGPTLAGYDGCEHEQDDFYIYRTN